MYVCANLQQDGEKTRCTFYGRRATGMKILMQSEDGKFAYVSMCLVEYPRPQDAIPPECSYTFVPDELVQIQPTWNETYVPVM